MEENKKINSENEPRKYTPFQRIAAIIGVCLLGGMVIATLICAICKAPSNVTFALLFCDIIIPIMLWVFIRITKHYSDIGKARREEQ